MSNDSINAVSNAPVAAPKVKVAPKAVVEKAPKIAGDKLSVRRAPEKADEKRPIPSPAAEVPGEDIRNQVSLTGTVLGPVVTAKQTIGMLASTTFKSPVMAKIADGLVKGAGFLSKFRILNNPLVTGGLKVVSRALPFVGLGLLSFDGFATVKTFMNPEASGLRKGLTFGRFFFNAISTGVSFIPGAGFVYSLLPGLIGNGFEIAMAKMNGGAAQK